MLARRYGLGKQLIDMAFGATGPAPPLEVTRVRWGGVGWGGVGAGIMSVVMGSWLREAIQNPSAERLWIASLRSQ